MHQRTLMHATGNTQLCKIHIECKCKHIDSSYILHTKSTITCTALKCVLHCIIVLISVQEDGTVEVLQRMDLPSYLSYIAKLNPNSLQNLASYYVCILH